MIVDEKEENQILDEFRKVVKDLGQSEPTLRRFLRARNHDIPKAEDMLRKMVAWREENDVDNALKWEVEDQIVKEFPIEFPGVDYDNHAVMYIGVGAWHVRANIEKGNREQMLQYIYVCLERLVENIEKVGDQFTMIVDLAEMTYWKVAHYETIQMTLKVFRDFEANYPERLAEALVINAPLVLNYVWPLIKPLLTGRTLHKVKFLGSNPNVYIPEILKRMPASCLGTKLTGIMKQNNIRPIECEKGQEILTE